MWGGGGGTYGWLGFFKGPLGMSLRSSDPRDISANLKSTGGQICIFSMKKAAWAEEEEGEGDGGTEFEKRLYLLLSSSCVLICYDTG